MEKDMSDIRKIIRDHLEKGDSTGWFEQLYQHANGDPSIVPWAHMRPRRELMAWLARTQPNGQGRQALVIGCGLGDDAEALAERGYDTVAFDVSHTAIDWCRQRFADSPVTYAVADLFHPPAAWERKFDLVVEAYIVQALPPDMREQAVAACARFVAPGGQLIAIGRGIDDGLERTGPPWPLFREELALYERYGLVQTGFSREEAAEIAPQFRYRAEYRHL